jgi:hypothetical protein
VTKAGKLVTTSGGVEVGVVSFTVSALGVLDGGGALGGALGGGGGVEVGEVVGLRMPEMIQPRSVQAEDVGVGVVSLSVSAGEEEGVSTGGVLDGGGVVEGGMMGGRQPRPSGSKQAEDDGACEVGVALASVLEVVVPGSVEGFWGLDEGWESGVEVGVESGVEDG